MNTSLTNRIALVREQNIPILNDNLEALRRVCKVVWPDGNSEPSGSFKYYYSLFDKWGYSKDHENSHLAIPASEFFEVQVATHYQDLFNLLSKEHGLTLTISEMDEIIHEVAKMLTPKF